jgi:K(+)-stimulated pyrophosphate-energized sodium pump
MNILIKLMSIVSLVIAPYIAVAVDQRASADMESLRQLPSNMTAVDRQLQQTMDSLQKQVDKHVDSLEKATNKALSDETVIQ